MLLEDRTYLPSASSLGIETGERGLAGTGDCGTLSVTRFLAIGNKAEAARGEGARPTCGKCLDLADGSSSSSEEVGSLPAPLTGRLPGTTSLSSKRLEGLPAMAEKDVGDLAPRAASGGALAAKLVPGSLQAAFFCASKPETLPAAEEAEARARESPNLSQPCLGHCSVPSSLAWMRSTNSAYQEGRGGQVRLRRQFVLRRLHPEPSTRGNKQ